MFKLLQCEFFLINTSSAHVMLQNHLGYTGWYFNFHIILLTTYLRLEYQQTAKLPSGFRNLFHKLESTTITFPKNIHDVFIKRFLLINCGCRAVFHQGSWLLKFHGSYHTINQLTILGSTKLKHFLYFILESSWTCWTRV